MEEINRRDGRPVRHIWLTRFVRHSDEYLVRRRARKPDEPVGGTEKRSGADDIHQDQQVLIALMWSYLRH